ncbi:hypothetical protein GTW69_37230, partial [Streptomyces sp. SID7760]|nr:hypothetical protein [Streptomyces sp. SID7760]
AGAPRDLDGAIARYREAVPMFPSEHPGRVESLSHLGDALLARFDHAGDPADRDAALTAWSAAKATADIL